MERVGSQEHVSRNREKYVLLEEKTKELGYKVGRAALQREAKSPGNLGQWIAPGAWLPLCPEQTCPLTAVGI